MKNNKEGTDGKRNHQTHHTLRSTETFQNKGKPFRKRDPDNLPGMEEKAVAEIN